MSKKAKKQCCENGGCGTDACECQKHQCDACDNFEQFKAKEEEAMKKYGWVCHFVAEDDTTPTGANFHTHGFEKTFGCPDIQMVLPLNPELLHSLACCVVDLLKSGVKIHDGMFSDKVCQGFKVLFKSATECDRDVLRVILPDKNGCLTADAEDMFGDQFKDLK